MNRKIVRYTINHPWKCLVAFFIFLIVFGIMIFKIPKIIAGCIVLLFLAAIIISSYKEKKEKQKFKSRNKEDYEKEWMQYVDLVNEMIDERKYEINRLNADWLYTFDQIMYNVATNQYLLNRRLNDFDIAACLIYSLTLHNITDENILFAFECAKKIVNKPKEYVRDVGFGYKLELEVENIFQKVDIDLPNEIIIPIIRQYIVRKTERGIIQLSEYLHLLYLNCK